MFSKWIFQQKFKKKNKSKLSKLEKNLTVSILNYFHNSNVRWTTLQNFKILGKFEIAFDLGGLTELRIKSKIAGKVEIWTKIIWESQFQKFSKIGKREFTRKHLWNYLKKCKFCFSCLKKNAISNFPKILEILQCRSSNIGIVEVIQNWQSQIFLKFWNFWFVL